MVNLGEASVNTLLFVRSRDRGSDTGISDNPITQSAGAQYYDLLGRPVTNPSTLPKAQIVILRTEGGKMKKVLIK